MKNAFHARAMTAVRLNPGSSTAQLAELLELDRTGQNNLTTALTRLAARGLIRRERMASERSSGTAYRFWIAEAA